MTLRGMPSLAELRTGHARVLPAFDQIAAQRTYFVAPDRLTLATDAHTPAITLRLIAASVQTEPYGMLELKLAPRAPIEAGLEAARNVDPAASVSSVSLLGGWVRFRLLSPDGATSAMATPTRFSPGQAGMIEANFAVPMDSAVMLKRSLEAGTLPLEIWGELEFEGVAAQLAYRVTVSAIALNALAAMLDAEQRVARSALTAYLRANAGSPAVPCTPAVADEDRVLLAETLADWLIERFGKPVACPREPVEGYVQLPGLASAGTLASTTSLEWDLSTPRLARRTLIVPFDAAAVSEETAKATPIIEVRGETLPTGFVPLRVRASLGDRICGATAIGLTLRVPAKPPHRPSPTAITLDFLRDPDPPALKLRLSPGESLRYTYRTFVQFDAFNQHARADGVDVPSDDATLRVSRADFPARFVDISVAPGIAQLGVTRVECRRADATQPTGSAGATLSLELDQARRVGTFVIGSDVDTAELRADVVDAQRSRTARLGPTPAVGSIQLDLHSFPAFGPHAIDVSLVDAPANTSCLIYLEPEDQSSPPERVLLRSEQPAHTWRYHAASIFAPGYRFRAISAAGAAGEWSAIRSHDQPLSVRIDGTEFHA